MLGFVGAVYQMTPSEIERRAAQLVELFHFGEVLTQRIGHLSYGMKSRLVLMMSLLHDPQVLVLDEPFFGLDPQTLRLIKHLLRERAAQGMTVILSTHQLGIVEDVAHRIAILTRGRLVALGSLDALKRQYGGDRLEELFFQLTAAPSA